MNEDQIKYMRDRFLGWKLPENFNPDGGISFAKKQYNHVNEPSGTNVFDAQQTEQMIRYMLEGLPSEWQAMDTAPKNDDKFLVAFEVKGIDGRAVAETHWCDGYYAGFLSDDFILIAWTPLPSAPTR